MQALEAGKRFARYRVQRYLGSSVSGESYEAEDTLLQRSVTLKLIHPWARLSDAARRQFFREMQGIGALTHPSLAVVLDYGEVDGQLYIARRYVTPGSLLGSEGRDWFRPPLDVAHAVHYARQLAEALQHIHKNGFVHGSLTFTNILVLHGSGANDNAAPFLIADVGTAHFVRRFGKPQYSGLPITAAPEQFGQRVTPASDQYALAVLLYFWLTGRLPFLGTPEEVKQLKLTETLSTLTALNLNVPLELEGVIRRALHAYPEERYPSIQAFANALSAAITHAARAFPLSPVHVSQYNGDMPEATTLREVEIRSEETEKMPLAHTPSSESTATLSPESREAAQISYDHEQVFRDNPTPILELLSSGLPSADSRAQIEQPTQPTQPTQPELPSQPSVPEQPTPPESPELPAEPAVPEEPVQPTPQTTPDLPDQPDLPSQPVQPETPTEPVQPAQPEHPGPLPQTTPDVPQPLPEPTPEPEPLPRTPSEPTPAPTPEPDTLPPPAPDIPQPLPDPQPIPPVEPAQDGASALQEGMEANENEGVEEQSSGTPQASLSITSPFSDREVVLERGETTLGRAGSSDILLDQDTLTSRHHALLKRDGNSYFIRDERSANGITLNGEMIAGETDYELHNGDHIVIGEYTLVFRLKQPDHLAEQGMYQAL